MAKSIFIKGREIAAAHKPFIIAEMSGNHNRSLDKALEIVEAAARCGCDALKIQTYTPDTLTIDVKRDEFIVTGEGSPWKGRSLYDLYGEAYTPWEWHEAIFKRCADLGLIGFSSPFDETAVEFLEKLNAPAYKIASFENAHLPLIRKAAATGKALIISTGMSTLDELRETVEAARQAGCVDLILLKCTSSYPASPMDSNLATIADLREQFDVQVGLSDHTLGIGAAVASVALGACVIEKHFTLSRAEGGVDAAFSMEPDEMKMLVEETTRAWQALGKVHYGPTSHEMGSAVFRRSVYVVEDVKAGEVFTEKNLRIIRPGMGVAPKHIDSFIGKKAKRAIKRGTPMNFDLVE